MILNFEVTTHCNYSCFYCYQCKYEPKMMDFALFGDIVSRYDSVNQYRFAGEGETLLHPQFWDMVDHARTSHPHAGITAITNGSALTAANRERVKQKLDSIAVSVDTVDPNEAERIGRHDVRKVLGNITELAKDYKAITLYTVNYGQETAPIARFAESLGLLQLNMPLQAKPDYLSRYNEELRDYSYIRIYPSQPTSMVCGIYDQMHYYNVDGLKLPCCFIKDVSVYPGYDELKDQLAQGRRVPQCCTGCTQLQVT